MTSTKGEERGPGNRSHYSYAHYAIADVAEGFDALRFGGPIGQLLADTDAREQLVAASAKVVEQLGGALERTLAALEPYLLQLRLEVGAANA